MWLYSGFISKGFTCYCIWLEIGVSAFYTPGTENLEMQWLVKSTWLPSGRTGMWIRVSWFLIQNSLLQLWFPGTLDHPGTFLRREHLRHLYLIPQPWDLPHEHRESLTLGTTWCLYEKVSNLILRSSMSIKVAIITGKVSFLASLWIKIIFPARCGGAHL